MIPRLFLGAHDDLLVGDIQGNATTTGVTINIETTPAVGVVIPWEVRLIQQY